MKDEKAVLGPETGHTASYIFVFSRQETTTELLVGRSHSRFLLFTTN
jgi:hypothetical protein